MSTRKVKPDPGVLDRQHRRHRRRAVGMKLGAIAVMAAIVLVACSGPGDSPRREKAAATAGEPTSVAPDSGAVEVATAFVEAYGAFDIDRAITYLADDADVFGETLEDFRLGAAWFEAMGYKQTLDRCEVLGASASGTSVRCLYDFHSLRSEEIGLGPFGGSFFDLTVEDGAIVRVSQHLNYEEEFSTQVWEPFAKWVSTTYPEDAEVMYTDESLTNGRLTEKSFRLWEKHSREYAKEVAQS